MSYGENYYISEREAKKIRGISDDIQKEEKRRISKIRNSREDLEMRKDLGITREELNQNRMIG